MTYNELIISSGGNKGIATLGALTFFLDIIQYIILNI